MAGLQVKLWFILGLALTVQCNAADENITFFMFGRNLPSQYFDKIDPYVKVYETTGVAAKKVLIGTTDVLQNNPNPDFETPVSFNWTKGGNQTLTLILMDENPLRDSKMGEVTFSADALVQAPEGALNLTVKKGIIGIQKMGPLPFRINTVFWKEMNNGGLPFMEFYSRRGEKGIAKKFYKTHPFQQRFGAYHSTEYLEFPNYASNRGFMLLLKIRMKNKVLMEAVVPLDEFVQNSGYKKTTTDENNEQTLVIELNP